MSEKVIIEVNGLLIKENSLYKIVDKPDRNALDGLRQYGSTKIPSEFIGNTVPCRFINGLYDTGFYTQSPGYAGLAMEDRVLKVNRLVESIVEPYERVHGSNVLDNKNVEFYDNFSYNLFEGRIFNTSNIDDLIELYFAMSGFELTPKQLIGDPRFTSSQFCIEDREVSNKRKDQQTQDFMRAISSFSLLLTQDRHTLVAALKYVRMPGCDGLTSTTEESVFNSLYYDWINTDVKNIDDFLRVVETVNKKSGLEEVMLYGYLSTLLIKNKVYKVGDEFAFNDIPLGIDLKTSAKNLATKANLKQVKAEVIQTATE